MIFRKHFRYYAIQVIRTRTINGMFIPYYHTIANTRSIDKITAKYKQVANSGIHCRLIAHNSCNGRKHITGIKTFIASNGRKYHKVIMSTSHYNTIAISESAKFRKGGFVKPCHNEDMIYNSETKDIEYPIVYSNSIDAEIHTNLYDNTFSIHA
jgi:hypothetical protein